MRSRLTATIVAVAASSATLTLAMPVADAAAPRPKKVSSTVTIKGFDGSNADRVVFFGKVKSKKAACEKRRTVKLRQIDQDLAAGKDKTNRSGVWRTHFDGNTIDPGKFKATVLKKTIKVNGKRIVCAADTVTYDATGGA